MMIRKPSARFVPSLFILLLAGLPLGAIDASEWSLEDVLNKVEEANGGIDNIEAVSNLRVRGEAISDSNAYEFLLLKKRPSKVRIHVLLEGRSIETGFDGKDAWRRLWLKGVDRVSELSDVELAKANLDLDFDGPLIGEPLPGTTLNLEGVERIDRVDYFIVVSETATSRKRHFIDSRNFREWKTETEVVEDGTVTGTTTAVYSDYKRHNSIWVAHRIDRTLTDGSKETIIINEAEVNPGILDRAFRMPKQWSSDS